MNEVAIAVVLDGMDLTDAQWAYSNRRSVHAVAPTGAGGGGSIHVQ